MAGEQPDFTELNELRSVEELTHQAESIKRELDDLNREYNGLPFPEEVRDAFAGKVELINEIDRRVRELTARKELLERVNAEPERTERPDPFMGMGRPTSREMDIYNPDTWMRIGNPEKRGQVVRDQAMRAVELMTFPHQRADQDATKARLADLLDNYDTDDHQLAQRVLVTSSPAYKRAFVKLLRGDQLTPEEQRGTALAVGVDGTGGYAVPVVFDPTIIAIGAHTSVNPFRAACRVETIVGSDTYQVLTSTAVVAAYAAEANAATEQGPTFARPEFIVKRAHAFVTLSYEMLQDRPSLPAELSVLFQEAKDNLEEAQFATGAGTTVYPQGLALDGAFTAVETIGNNVVAIGDLRAIEAALPIRWRANAAWFMNRAMIRAAQGFETTGGQLFQSPNYPATPLARQNPTGNTGLTLLGYPLWETPSMTSDLTTSAGIVAVLADPRQYLIVDRVGMNVELIPFILNSSSLPTGQKGVYALWRNTARVITADAGRQLKVNAP